nr:MAG TPA: hypothetical protein [Caudoviricetes sp.]
MFNSLSIICISESIGLLRVKNFYRREAVLKILEHKRTLNLFDIFERTNFVRHLRNIPKDKTKETEMSLYSPYQGGSLDKKAYGSKTHNQL